MTDEPETHPRPATPAEEAFDEVVEALLAEPGTTEGTGFGTMPGVKIHGKIAAMLLNGNLVVKLPADRCNHLTAAGRGTPLHMGRRTMREWIVVPPPTDDWAALAREALEFVRP